MKIVGAFAVAVIALAQVAQAAPPDDQIRFLPGWEKPLPSRQWSGFLEIPGDDGAGPGSKFYHYWFVETVAENPDTAPVILWLNGGPGASSVGYGMFTEMGPFLFTENSSVLNDTIPTLYRNTYSWDQLGHLLFFEHPPSVGFSYCNSTCSWNDTTQAVASLEALEAFYTSFPEYKANDLYIVGESYGGIYAPTLTINALASKKFPQLKGLAVGNGCIGNEVGACSPQGTKISVDFLYGHGLVSQETYAEVLGACSGEFDKPAPLCSSMLQKMDSEVGQYYSYFLYDTCGSYQSFLSQRDDDLVPYKLKNKSPQRERLLGDDPFMNPCGREVAAETYFNNEYVQKMVNIYPAIAHKPEGWKFSLEAGPYLNYSSSFPSLLPYYPDVIDQIKVLIYNGDVDPCVPYVGNEHWTRSLGLEEKDPWRPWVVDSQMAGHVVSYTPPSENATGSFTFATVFGSGHMVPQYKPKQALQMLKSFIAGEPF